MSKLQQIADVTPNWANWLAIVGTALLTWIQPIAGLVAIIWGCLQIYLALEKRWRKRKE
jgi:hypothetical protein